jgi:hypothetical protein
MLAEDKIRFPAVVSYNRIAELESRVLFPLMSFLNFRLASCRFRGSRPLP